MPVRQRRGYFRFSRKPGRRFCGERSARDESIQLPTAIRIAEMLMGMLSGWWRVHQEIRRVMLEEALAYADYAVDVLFEGRVA